MHVSMDRVILYEPWKLITKTCLFKYTENFTTKKWKLSDKILIFFHIFTQNHRLWYSLEPFRRGRSNEYPQYMSRNKKNNVYPVNPSFNV